jgi:hypothetical protein
VEAVLTRFAWIVPALAMSAAVSSLAAQEVRDPLPPQVPGSFTPPAGLCRVWLNGVPASQQPAPTDCASAIKNRPSNAAVLFGPNPSRRRSEPGELDSFVKSGMPAARRFTPNTLAPRRRDDVRDRDHDRDRERTPDTSTAKATRKPEKPQ